MVVQGLRQAYPVSDPSVFHPIPVVQTSRQEEGKDGRCRRPPFSRPLTSCPDLLPVSHPVDGLHDLVDQEDGR